MKTRTPIKKVTDRLLPVQIDALKDKLSSAGIHHKERATTDHNLILVYPKSINQRHTATAILR